MYWWPQIDIDLEREVINCPQCQALQNNAPQNKYVPWEQTDKPFQRVHLDFFHFAGRTCLLLVDSCTRWIEVWKVKSTSSDETINCLKECFERYGYLSVIACDNGHPFSRRKLKEF